VPSPTMLAYSTVVRIALNMEDKHTMARHIRNEAAMHHTDRKSFTLLCQYTIAASWGALRKAWLGFKIANSKHDTQKKRHYSRIIRKLQLEMGIGKTHFDLDILDDETIWQIEQEVKALARD
jgi:hypothetical protein